MLVGRAVTADDVETLTWSWPRSATSGTGPLSAGRDAASDEPDDRVLVRVGYDLLLTPTMAEIAAADRRDRHPAPDLEGYARCLPSGAFTALFNVTGQPAISCRCT